MKILFQEDYDDSQDDFLEEKQKIIDCPFSLHDLRSLPEILMWWLEIRVFRNEEDYFNLRLWIDVLNKIDSAMDLIIRTLSARAEILESTNKIGNSSSQQSPAGDCDSDNGFATDQDLISAAKILIKWTSSFLSCSCNKIVFNSVDVSVLRLVSYQFIKLIFMYLFSAETLLISAMRT